MIGRCLVVILIAGAAMAVDVEDLARVKDGWTVSVVAEVDQSYAGWDVEIGDADNDGLNEVVLATGRGDRMKPGVSYVVVLERRPRV